MEFAFVALQATRDHAVRSKSAEYDHFRQALTEILDALKGKPDPSSLLTFAAATTRKIEHYCRQTQSSFDSVIVELYDIIGVLLSAMDKTQAHCDHFVSALHEIEERIKSTRTVEELKAAKADLGHVLGGMQERTLEQKRAACDLVAGLQKRVLTLEKGAKLAAAPPPDLRPGAGAPVRNGGTAPTVLDPPAGRPVCGADLKESRLDPTTGLPDMVEAEDTILALPAKKSGLFLAALYVQRMDYVNARFGSKIASEVLLFCSQLIASRLIQPADRLFRWKGPAFVALLQRDDSLIDVRQEVRRLVGSRVHFEWRNGSLLLSIGLAGDVIPTAVSGGKGPIGELERLFASLSLRGTA